MDIRKAEYDQIRKNFLGPLLNPQERRICENLWIKGDKGVGKSLLLKKLAYDLYAKPDIITLYIKVPDAGLDLTGVYVRSIGWLGLETFTKLAQKIYEDFFDKLDINTAIQIFKIPADQIEEFTDKLKEIVKKQPDVIFSLFSKNPRELRELQEMGIAPGAVKINALEYSVSANLVANHGLLKKFADLISDLPENPNAIFASIQNVTPKLAVPMLIACERAFSDFIGARAFVMILDEFEIAWRRMTEKERLKTVVAVRALHDSSQGDMKFIVTVIQEVFDVLPQDKYKHILDVIPKTAAGTNIVDIKKLDDSQALQLVEFLLSQEGIRTGSAPSYVYPFVTEVITAVNNKVGGVTRDLIVELRHIIEEAEGKKMTVIDKANLLKISDEFAPYLQPEAHHG